jgi:hypothetical protein
MVWLTGSSKRDSLINGVTVLDVLTKILTGPISRGASVRRCMLAAAVLSCGAVLPGVAQEGHPLKGSWLGTWESNDVHGENVLLVLDWDGENITGIINPGTDNIEITEATLDPDDWVVSIEAEASGESDPVHYVIAGKIENLELPNRSIVGTWEHQRGGGVFNVSRQ